MRLEVISQHTAELFSKIFGRAPRWLVAAPGRVNLIGEHTDYSQGLVLPMAIERHTVIAARPNTSREAVLHSETTGDTARFALRAPIERGDPPWSNYPRGVIAGFQALGTKVSGFEAVIESSLPYGGGLASSAALEVAMANLLECMRGEPVAPLEKAMLCQRAEHDFAGVPCGLMDPFTCITARENEVILLDCKTAQATPVPFRDPTVAVLVINTNTRHDLALTEYAKRRAQCEEAAHALGVSSLRDVTPERLENSCDALMPTVFHKARHVVYENERVLRAASCMSKRDWQGFGKLMYASHESLRDEFQVSTPELDAAVRAAQSLGEKEGVYGARMTGAGFGGCVICLVRSEAAPVLTKRIAAEYEQLTGSVPTLFVSRAAAGARVLSVPALT